MGHYAYRHKQDELSAEDFKWEAVPRSIRKEWMAKERLIYWDDFSTIIPFAMYIQNEEFIRSIHAGACKEDGLSEESWAEWLENVNELTESLHDIQDEEYLTFLFQ